MYRCHAEWIKWFTMIWENLKALFQIIQMYLLDSVQQIAEYI